jgi:protein phosphatase
MTEDHSATMALVKQGLITMDEARTHEDRNVILRAVGTRPELEVAVWETPFSLRAGDHFLLCTDGLHDVVTDAEMCAIVAAHPPEEACAQFIKLALNRVCSDNVTVGVLRVSDSEEAEGSSLAETREVKLI